MCAEQCSRASWTGLHSILAPALNGFVFAVRFRFLIFLKGSNEPLSQKNSCLCLYTVLGSIQWAHGAPEDPSLRIFPLGFPGGAVVESLAAGAGDTGSSPGLGGSHMPRSGWAREPQLLSLRVWSLCSTTREAAMVRGPRMAMRGGPRLPQLERALAQKRRPNTAKNKLIN